MFPQFSNHPHPSCSSSSQPYPIAATSGVSQPSPAYQVARRSIPTPPPLSPDDVLPLDFIPLTPEEINEHSLFSKPVQRSRLRGTPQGKTLQNFTKGFLDNTGGLSTRDNISCWDWLIDNCEFDFEQKKILSAEVKRLKTLQDNFEIILKKENPRVTSNVASQFAREVHGLNPGESRLMTGHLLRSNDTRYFTGYNRRINFLYEFTKAENGTYTITLCSSSAFKLSQIFLKGDKTRFVPLISYTNIPEHKLFFNDKPQEEPASGNQAGPSVPAAAPIRNDFFKALIDLETSASNDIEVTEERIFQILDDLGVPPTIPASPQCITTLERVANPSTESPSGIASLKVWIRKLTNDNIDAYRQIMFHLKFKLFVSAFAAYTELEENSLEGKNQRIFLERTARNLLRRVAKLTNSNTLRAPGFENRPFSSSSSSYMPAETDPVLLDPTRALVAIATAYDAIRRVQQINKKIALDDIQPVDTSQRPIQQIKSLSSSRAGMNYGKDIALHSKPKKFNDVELPIYYEIGTSDKLLSHALLETINHLRDKTKSTETINKMIDHLVDQLPIPQWSLPKQPTTPTSSSSPVAASSNAVVPELEVLEPIAPANPFWDNLNAHTALQLAQNLQTLLECYGNDLTPLPTNDPFKFQVILSNTNTTLRNNVNRLTRLHATVLALHAIIHYLVIKIDREKMLPLRNSGQAVTLIEEYKTPYHGLVANELDLVYLDPKEFDRVQKANAYFADFNREKNRFEGTLFHYFRDESLIIEELATQFYFRDLVNALPRLKAEVKSLADARKHFKKLSEEQIEFDYQQEVAAKEKWESDNALYQQRQNYEKALSIYRGQSKVWSIYPNKYTKPTEVPYPGHAIANAPHPGAQPKNPERKCNLTREQKNLAIMKELDPNLLRKHGLSHLLILRETIYYSREQMHSPHKRIFVHFEMRRSSPYTRDIQYTQSPLMTDKPNLEALKNLIHQFYPLNAAARAVLGCAQIDRKVDKRQRAVAEAITLGRDTITDPFYKKLLRATSESDLTPYQLIFEAKQELERFSSRETQSLFFRLFFRSPISEKGQAKLGTGQYIFDDHNALFDACQGFIQQGFEYYASKANPDTITKAETAMKAEAITKAEAAAKARVVALTNIDARADASAKAEAAAKAGVAAKAGAAIQASAAAIAGGRFFLELSYYLSRYLKDNVKESRALRALELSQLDTIETWLANPVINNQGKSILHFYRILFYSISVEKLSNDDYARIFESWVQYRTYRDPQEPATEITKFADEFIEKTITDLEGRFQREPQFLNELCNNIMSSVGISNFEHQNSDGAQSSNAVAAPATNWIAVKEDQIKDGYDLLYRSKYRTVEVKTYPTVGTGEPGNQYQLNLMTGEIITPQGPFNKPQRNVNWSLNTDFQRIFKKRAEDNDDFVLRTRKFQYVGIEEETTNLLHPEFEGLFQLIGNQQTCVIRRQFPGSDQWYQYMPPDKIKFIPRSFIADHTYWGLCTKPKPGFGLFSDNESGLEVQGYFTSLRSQKRKFVLLKNGDIVEVDSVTGKWSETSRKVEDNPHAYPQFDRSVLAYLNADNVIQRLQFTRYASLDHNPLAFINNKGHLVWTENEQYCLLPKTPKGYLGTFPNYLYLQPLDAKLTPKLLVPFSPLNTLSSTSSLHVDNATPLVPVSDKEQWGQYQYFTYDIQGVTLKPTSQEAQLFLAYLHLSRAENGEAIALLTALNGQDKLSNISMTILRLIVGINIYNDDRDTLPTPDEKMVILHAILQMMKEKDRRANEKVEYYFDSTIDPNNQLLTKCYYLLHDCYESLNNISVECRFTLEDEKYFLDRIQHEFRKEHPNDNANNNRAPSMLQNMLSFIAGGEAIANSITKNRAILNIPEFLEKLSNRAEWIEGLSSRHQHQVIPKGVSKRTISGADANHEAMAKLSDNHFFNLPKKSDIQVTRSVYDYKTHNFKRVSRTKEEIQAEYEENLSRRLDTFFTTTRFSSSYETCVMPTYATSNSFLFEVNRIAQTESLGVRKSLLFWVRLWRIQAGQPEQRYRLDLLTLVLLRPDSFPKPIDLKNRPSLEEQRQFLEAFNIGYQKLYRSYRKYYKKPSKSLTMVSEYSGNASHITGTSVFDLKQKVILSDRTPQDTIEMTLDPQENRWLQLTQWKDTYLKPLNLPSAPSQKISYAYEEGMLTENDSDHKDPLINALAEAQTEHENGKAKNEAATTYQISSENCMELSANVAAEIQRIEQQLKASEELLITSINREPIDEIERRNVQAKLGGQVQKRLTFKDCLSAVLSMDFREFTLKNPSLTSPEEISDIAHQTMAVCDMKSHLAQLKRIQDLTGKLIRNSISDLERSHLVLKMEEELAAHYEFESFSDEIQVALRVFSGETGKIPFPYQTRLLKKMMKVEETDPARYKDIVIQLIMGGGKTSVLATIMMYLAARRKERIAMFIVPAALFDPIKNNLGASLKEAFNVDLEPIDLTREEMTPYRLNRIKEMMQKARAESLPLIAKASTLQALQLECYSEALTFKKNYLQIKESKKLLPQKQAELKEKESLFQNAWSVISKGATRAERNRVQSQIDKIKKQTAKATDRLAVSRKKLSTLNEILRMLLNNTDALIDEVDQVLNALQEVNFPVGDKVLVSDEGIDLMEYIYQGLVNKNIMAQPPKAATENDSEEISVDALLNLTRQDRTVIDKSVFIERIVPSIAGHLVNTYPPFLEYFSLHKAAAIRFLSGETPLFIEQYRNMPVQQLTAQFLNSEGVNWNANAISTLQEDLRFRQRLDALYHSTNTNEEIAAHEKNIANMISLARGLLLEIMPATLSKSGNRDYGIKFGTNGRIIPYLGVNTPATTEFGYHWEEACYYYQWAAAFSPSEQEILALADDWDAAARDGIQTKSIPYEASPEYTHFKKLFGVPLNTIREKGKVQEAIANLRKDIRNCLELQSENVAKFVSYYPERLNSNGANLITELASRRGMSGTPWNVEGYIESMLERYKQDKGTEGRVFDALAKKTFPEKISTVSLDTVTSFMDSTFANIPDSEHSRVTGIIEAGALFKKFPKNDQVARELMEYLAKKPSHAHIEGVLFFHRDGENSTDDTLYVWKKGARRPEKIGGTSLEALKAKNLSPQTYFTYYAERNTTGTDIPQLPDAISIFTFDEKMCTRNTAQALMRYRQFLTSQETYIMMTEQAKQYIHNGGNTVGDLINHGIVVQTVKKSNHMDRHFSQMIRNIFRMTAAKELSLAIEFSLSSGQGSSSSSNSDEYLIGEIERYESTILQSMRDEPYLQFGHLKGKVETKSALIQDLEHKLEKFLKVLPQNRNESKEELTTLVEKMRAHIQEAKSLPKFRDQVPESLGLQVEQEQESLIEVEQEVETETEIENEVELELQQYREVSGNTNNKEPIMRLEDFQKILKVMRRPNLESTTYEDADWIIPLPKQLGSYSYGPFLNRTPFQNAFTQPIFGTYDYFHACQNILPVFHDKQRPPKQILAMRMEDGTIRWLLLSERQGHYARKHLGTLYGQNSEDVTQGVWLVQPDGSGLFRHDNMESFPMIRDETLVNDDVILNDPVSLGLLELNAFAGHIDYIDNHKVTAEAWLKTNTALKLHFLKLMASRDPKQKRAFETSSVIAMKETSAKKNTTRGIRKARMTAEETRQGNFVPNSVVDAKTMKSSIHIQELNCEWVKHLGIDINSTNPDDVAAVDKVREYLSNPKTNTGKTLEEEVAYINELQFSSLRLYHGPHITPEQVRWVPPSNTKILRDRNQFCTFNADSTIRDYLLTAEQVLGRTGTIGETGEGITIHQSGLIPYINPEFYRSFTTVWQIQHVPVEHLRAVNPDYYHLLSDEQIHRIQDQDLMAELIQRDLLGHEHYNIVHGNLCHLLPPEAKRQITPQQISEIDRPDIIALLPQLEEEAGKENGEFTCNIHENMVRHINPETQLAYLQNQRQIAQVSDEWVPLLDNETQVPLIAPRQVNFLTTAQLEYCPNRLIQQLAHNRIPELLDDQLPYLRGEEQIRAIDTPERFACLRSVTAEGIANQMQWIALEQYRWLTDDQVKGLNKNQLMEISQTDEELWSRIRNLIELAQIRSFDSVEFVALLTDAQIEAHLGENQVQFLRTAEQIVSCPVELVHKVTPEQAAEIPPEKIQALTKKTQIERVPDLLVPHLSIQQIQHVPNRKLSFVPAEKSFGLTGSQLLALKATHRWAEFQPQITREQAETFTTPETFNLLTPEQITQFATEGQVRLMRTPEQIQACPPALVRHLHPDTQVPHILPTQVPHLEGEQQHAKLVDINNDAYFENVNVRQYPNLPVSLKDRLTPQKVDRFDKAEPDRILGLTLPYLRNNREYAITPTNPVNLVKHLNTTQFSEFQNNDVDGGLAKRLTSDQVRQIAPTHQNLLNNILPTMAPNLPNTTLPSISVDNQQLLKNVPNNRIHHLEYPQIKARDLSWWMPKICYRIVGTVRTVFIPFTLVVQLVIDVVKVIFRSLKCAWNRSDENKSQLIRQLKKTFCWNPKITLIAPVQIWRPEVYWKMRSRYAEHANGPAAVA